MSESLYPVATQALADQRKALASKCEDAFQAVLPQSKMDMLNQYNARRGTEYRPLTRTLLKHNDMSGSLAES